MALSATWPLIDSGDESFTWRKLAAHLASQAARVRKVKATFDLQKGFTCWDSSVVCWSLLT